MSGTQLGKDPSGVPPTDLSSLFAPAAAAVPDRTQGVPKLTPPAPAVPAVAAQRPVPTTAAAEPDAEARPARARRTHQATGSRKPKRHPSSVVIYLSVSLRSRLRDYAQNTSRSHTQIVFDALNATHHRLAELAAASSKQPAEQSDGLFVVQRSTRQLHEEDQVQVSIRPNPTNLAVIDRLAEQHTSGNRTALIAVALDEYLPRGDGAPSADQETA